MKKNHLHRLLSLFILVSFLLTQSHLFIYRHYCGEELYQTSFYGTVSCGCEGEEIHYNVSSQVLHQDNDCCKETFIYAHSDNSFIFYIAKIVVLVGLLLAVIFLVIKRMGIFLLNTSYLTNRDKIPIDAVFKLKQHSLVSTFVLRN